MVELVENEKKLIAKQTIVCQLDYFKIYENIKAFLYIIYSRIYDI